MNARAWEGTLADPRGVIESLCDEPVHSVLRIFSKAGSVRSNHYHKTDWHICYVVSGRMEYYALDRDGHKLPEVRTVLAGEYVHTGPNVEHTTVFPEDTVLLVFAGNKRDREGYEDDLVRVGNLAERIWQGEFHSA